MLFLQTYWVGFLLLSIALYTGAFVSYLRVLCKLGSIDVFDDFTPWVMIRSFLPSGVLFVLGSVSSILCLIGIVLSIVGYFCG